MRTRLTVSLPVAPLAGRGRYTLAREEFDGWPLPEPRLRGDGRGKSGLHRAMMPANGRAGRPDGKCHRNIPPALGQVRAKWCGKSAPGAWRQARRVNPIWSKAESAAVTAARWETAVTGDRSGTPPRSEEPLEDTGNGIPREMATQTQNPAYRRTLSSPFVVRRGR